MLLGVLPVFLFLVPVSFSSKERPTFDEYCRVDKENTACRTKCARNRESCGVEDLYRYQHLTFDEKVLCLQVHNKLRNDLAAGKYAGKGFQAASNMMALSWDKECEWMTACHIRQCTYVRDKVIRPVSIGDKWQGQCLYKNSFDVAKLDRNFVSGAVNRWFITINNFDTKTGPNIVRSYADNSSMSWLKDFGQMIWGETRYVGCAKYAFKEGTNFTHFFSCNYYPPGLTEGQPIYLTGNPTTKCPRHTEKNAVFPNLCGQVRDFKLDPYVGPLDFDPEGTKAFVRAIIRHDKIEKEKEKTKVLKIAGGGVRVLRLSWLCLLLRLYFTL